MKDLKLTGTDLPGLAAKAAHFLIEFYSQPPMVAALVAMILLAPATRHMRTVPGVVTLIAAGFAGMQAYEVVTGIRGDLRTLAKAAGNAPDPTEP